MGYVADGCSGLGRHRRGRRRGPYQPRGVIARTPRRRTPSSRTRSYRGRGRTGRLGFFGIDRLIEYGGGQIIDAVTGSGRTGDDKANLAISGTGAASGPYDEAELLQAIRAAGSRSASVSQLRQATLIKDWLQGIGIETDDRLLANAAVFLAHGGQDGKQGATEQKVSQAVVGVLAAGGTSTQPAYVTEGFDYVEAARRAGTGVVDALQERYLTPEQRAAGPVGATIAAATRSPYFWPIVAGAGFLALRR